MGKDTTRSFETRVHIDLFSDQILHSCAELFGHLQHRLFADIASGKSAGELKNDYLACYQITARHFNGIRVQVEGKIASIQKRQPTLIAEAKERITSLGTKLKKLIKRKTNPQVIHQKKRRLIFLEHKLEQLKKDQENSTIRCCFGSKKLFRAQFNLEKNGYASHEAWLQSWRKERTKEIFFLGSKDETGGNQSCTATLQPDQTLQLRIRLPDALNQGKYLVIPNVNFHYGKEEIHALLKNPENQAITWRLMHDKKGWRVFATCDIKPPPCTSKSNLGVIGLDINADHLALVETDRQGNPICKKTIPVNLYGKNTHQAQAIIGDASALCIAYAEQTHKPLIIEDLDFQKKKQNLREQSRASHARMLSSFAYNSVITHLKSRASKKGVLVEQVNPAYTSIIGRIKFAARYGLSIHHAAALTIGRRYLRFSERPASSLSKIPDGKNGHVTLSEPVRNRHKHVWTFWKQLSKKLKTALAAHFRTAQADPRARDKPAPATEPLSKVVGAIPTRESSEALLA
jgi:IS605 OrfB family transposase